MRNSKKSTNSRLISAAYTWFIDHTDTLIIKGLARYKKDLIPPGNIYSFANQRFTTKEFAAYLEKRGSMIVTDDPEYFIDRSIETRISDQIMLYENSVLEKKYPDFRYLMNEFYDGILLFEISGRKVWNKVREDSTGLSKYYEEHKNNYLTRRAIDAKIYSLASPGNKKKLISAYKKYSRKSDRDNLLRIKFNSKGDSLLSIKDGTWFKGDNPHVR